MRVFKGLIVSGAAALMALSGALTAVPAGAEQAGDVGIRHYVCDSDEPPNLDDQPLKQSKTDLRLYSGSAIPCIGGIARKGDWLDYHCWTLGADNQTWTYVSAFERDVAGWAPDAKLPDNGSNKRCPQ